jgi:uncharacterized protein YciI
MTFLIHAFDHKDSEAITRRLAAREKHLEGARALHKEGKIVMAGAMIGQNETMMGSVVIVEMDSLEEVEQWLREEIYIQENVWDNVNIYPMRIAIR